MRFFSQTDDIVQINILPKDFRAGYLDAIGQFNRDLEQLNSESINLINVLEQLNQQLFAKKETEKSVFCELFDYLINKMEKQAEDAHFTYHTAYHALEMMYDAVERSKINHVPDEFLPIIACCALFHDAVFSRSRIADEQESANELFRHIAPLIETLKKEEIQSIQALIRVLIIGGTLPVVYQEENSNDLYLHPLWKVALRGHKYPLLPLEESILSACVALSDADIHRSLKPSSLKSMPLTKVLDIPLSSDQLTRIIKTHQADSDPITIMTKLGQSIRNMGETVSKKTEDPDEHDLKINRFIKKLRSYLLELDREIEITDADIPVLIELLKGEIFFTKMMQRSLNKDNNSLRQGDFDIDSWEIQGDIYHTIIEQLEDPSRSLENKSLLIADLITLARHQQGRYLNTEMLCQNLEQSVISSAKQTFIR